MRQILPGLSGVSVPRFPGSQEAQPSLVHEITETKYEQYPGDSKWPFDPLVGGHDSPLKRVTFSPSQKGHELNHQDPNVSWCFFFNISTGMCWITIWPIKWTLQDGSLLVLNGVITIYNPYTWLYSYKRYKRSYNPTCYWFLAHQQYHCFRHLWNSS